MKNLIYLLLVLSSLTAYGQIIQNINKTSGNVPKPITQIDSIRFNTVTNQMEIIQTNGNSENHLISDIINVTFSGQLIGTLTIIDCAGATTTGTLTIGTAANGVSTTISYAGGNAGTYSAQNVASTGVTGLTASLAAGTLANGNGSITYTITGTPASSGTASFAITLGGLSCTFNICVFLPVGTFSPGTINCSGISTQVVDVTNPTTGKIWMDRNLGASQVATSATDQNSFGDLYQWGRPADGHQCRNSTTTNILSSVDQPGHDDYILADVLIKDWRSPQNNNLWQGQCGINNPCPGGYRIPTATELNAERLSWTSNNTLGAFASPLKLPSAGHRNWQFGSIEDINSFGGIYSSTISGVNAVRLTFIAPGPFGNGNAVVTDYFRAQGYSVRCIKN